jgi:hypothetical protein
MAPMMKYTLTAMDQKSNNSDANIHPTIRSGGASVL